MPGSFSYRRGRLVLGYVASGRLALGSICRGHLDLGHLLDIVVAWFLDLCLLSWSNLEASLPSSWPGS